MKSAMKEKNQAKLAAVRAIKAEILKEQTSGRGTEVTDADVLKRHKNRISFDLYHS